MFGAFSHVAGFTESIFSGTIRSLDDLKQATQDLLQGMASEIARFMAQKAVMSLLTWMTGGHSLPGQSTSALSAIMSAGAGVIGSADGNVLLGGFKAFATGGVIDRPTLGLIGEGRMNEAVVPLPDGRSIPVAMQGPSKQTIEVVWSADMVTGMIAAAARQGAQIAGQMVVPIVTDNIQRNGAIRKAFQLG
jgi:phage-related minor tail protein